MSVRYAAELHSLMVPVTGLRQHPENPHNGDIEAIADSIMRNGCYRPIIVQRSTWTILAGHHLYAALCFLGEQEVPVIQVECDDRTANRILLADNQLAKMGMDDEQILLDLLRKMNAVDNLSGTGFTAGDIAILEAVHDPVEVEEVEFVTMTMKVPTQTRDAFLGLTEGDTMGARLHSLMRQAGWSSAG